MINISRYTILMLGDLMKSAKCKVGCHGNYFLQLPLPSVSWSWTTTCLAKRRRGAGPCVSGSRTHSRIVCQERVRHIRARSMSPPPHLSPRSPTHVFSPSGAAIQWNELNRYMTHFSARNAQKWRKTPF